MQRLAEDDFLSPLTIDERNDPVGPDVCQTSARCSDKGFLPMSLDAYFDLLNWLVRKPKDRKRASYPESVSSTLQRLGIDGATFTELSSDFGKLFSNVAGFSECVDSMRTYRTGRRFYLRRRARELMTRGDCFVG